MSRPSPARLAALLVPLALGACASGGGGPHKELVNPASGPAAPFLSTAVRTGNLLFLSGVTGRSPDNSDIAVAAESALNSIRERLALAGATMEDVVKCTVFLLDMADYQGMNGVYQRHFGASPPARTAIAVSQLPGNAHIEIECIAAVR